MQIKEFLEQAEEQLELFGNGDAPKMNLKQLKKAIREVNLGTYGRCQICKKLIGANDLAEYPHTTTCHECGFKYDQFPWAKKQITELSI
jgi:RNA polymerase-binding transcription factor DksA